MGVMMNWGQAIPVAAAAFAACLVECIEALTVILAVGASRGWLSALFGAAAALTVLCGLVAAGGPALQLVPVSALRLILGILLLVLGLHWLRKAVLRAGGRKALRDEQAAYAREAARLGGLAPAMRWDRVALATTFQITLVEGVEVVFIVLATGARGLLPASIAGAAAAPLLVTGLGLALHRPIAAIPENTLKFAVAVLLCAYGSFWLGEGVGLRWPGGDLALPCLIAAYLVGALAAVVAVRDGSRPRSRG